MAKSLGTAPPWQPISQKKLSRHLFPLELRLVKLLPGLLLPPICPKNHHAQSRLVLQPRRLPSQGTPVWAHQHPHQLLQHLSAVHLAPAPPWISCCHLQLIYPPFQQKQAIGWIKTTVFFFFDGGNCHMVPQVAWLRIIEYMNGREAFFPLGS